MEDDILERFTVGIQKFNDGEFYECHDILEDIWFEIRGSDRKFYQGLIHLAVGYYHLHIRYNPKGALSQLSKGISKLSMFKPAYQGIELDELLEKVNRSIDGIKLFQDGKQDELDQIKIPKVNFDKKLFKKPGRE